jgi:hypothetical protein
VRVSNLAVRRISLEHHPFQRDVLERLQVLLRLEAAAVDADVEIQLYYLLDLFDAAREGVDYSRGEAISVLPDEVVEVVAGVPVVEVHGQLPLFGQVEVEGEDC